MVPTLTPQKFVTDAATGNLKEIAYGQVALEQSQNAEVKRFASTIIRDHTAANNQLDSIARQEGLTMPSTNTFTKEDTFWGNPLSSSDSTPKGLQAQLLTATNWPNLSDYRGLNHLKSLSGPQFDQAYLSDMVNDHAQDIAEFERASRELSDVQLKQYATSTLPTLKAHYRMAQQLASKFAATPSVHPVMQSVATPGLH